MDKDHSQGLNLPIDIFFRSLAEDVGSRAVGIILSGTGSDGTNGILAIHEAGGLVIVQEQETAKFDGMPRSAMATGIADHVLPPAEMPAVLAQRLNTGATRADGDAAPPPAQQGVFAEVYSLLRGKYGIDFTHYKPTTVTRRLERRVSMNRLESVSDYIKLLRDDERELDALYRDLLIGVTRFFRDPEAYAVIEREVLPRLFRRTSAEEDLRIWVPGCATGEEAYSLAILLAEHAAEHKKSLERIKIFATDVHRDSLDRASIGKYDEAAVEGIDPKRLNRFFTRHANVYQVTQDIRRMVVFAPHNLLKDPPFTKIDFISCRNVLIYLMPAAQRKVLSMFHFALQTNGLLLLGPSENVGSLESELEALNQRWKLYRKRRDVRLPGAFRLPMGPQTTPTAPPRPPAAQPGGGGADMAVQRAYDALLERHVPPSLLINQQHELIHVFGDAGKYLRPGHGKMSLDVMKMLDEDLKAAVSAAIHRAAKEVESVAYRSIRVRRSDGEELVSLNVQPINDRKSDATFFLITLQSEQRPQRPETDKEEFDRDESSRERISELEYELVYTKEHLQATIEELETSNEELQSTNEELLASNEELQSTNEELHSVNEELYSVNAEYQRKIDELTELNNDIDNLLRSTNIGTVFLDRELRIRKFTPVAASAFNLLPQDIDRPIGHLSSNLDYPALLQDVRQVLDSESPMEREVTNSEGQRLLARVLPYRNEMNDVGGVVLTFIDITQLRRAEDKLVEAEKRFRELAESIDEVFWMASADGAEMLYVSPGFERIWGRPVSFVHEQPGSWLETVHPEDREQLTQLLFHAEPNQTWEIEYRILCPDGSERWIRDRGMAIADRQGQIVRLTGVAEDISERKKADERLRILERAVEQSVDSIVVADLDGRILFANAGCGRLHGYSPDELLGKPICMLHDPSHEVDNGLCPFLAGVDEPGWAVREVEHARRDGTRFPAEKTVSVLCGPDGQRLGYVVIARDQTAQRRAQQESAQLAEQLARTVRELKRSNSELEHFAYVASHDLQEPLRTMASFCRLLEQKYKDKLDDDANRYIEHVVSGANRMKALVSGLLAFSRVTMRGQSFEPTDMDEVVEGALANLRTTIVETNARITHDQLPTIDIDRAQFTQLMQNLIGNGIKFHDGGAPKIHVGVEDKDDHWLFSVRDNGIGISEEYTSRIFSIFQRLHTHDEYPGTGIGLALCKRIVERRGGRIWAESAPGEGSTFFFTIPKEQPTATPLDASFDNKPDSPTQQGDA